VAPCLVRSRNLTLMSTVPWNCSLRKTMQSGAVWNNVLLTPRNVRARSALVMGAGLPWLGGPFWQLTRAIDLHMPILCYRMKDPFPFSQRTDTSVRLPGDT
jgi:hypothetical protein